MRLRGSRVSTTAADFGKFGGHAPADDVGLQVGGAVDAVDPHFDVGGAFRAGSSLGGGDDVEPSGIRVDQSAVVRAVVL